MQMTTYQRLQGIAALVLLLIGLIGAAVPQSHAQAESTEDPNAPLQPAQTVTEEPTQTPIPQVVVSGSEPARMTSGAEGSLSIFGQHFTTATTVRLVGAGLLNVTFINETSLLATIPRGLPAGTYGIEVSDPVRGSATAPTTLQIIAPAAPTNLPPPAATLVPTPLPPTPVPGQPSLTVSRYTAQPQLVTPGGTVTFSITVINQGNRSAQSISAAIDGSGVFLPAASQTSVLLPDLPPGGSYSFSIAAVASSGAAAGTNNVALTLNYRDFENNLYSAPVTLVANVDDVVQVSQITLSSYNSTPDPLQPGAAVTLGLRIKNSGTTTATQALLTVPISGGVLLAGPQGSTFALGDIAAGTELSLYLPLVVSSSAPPGVQPQTLLVSFLQNGSTQQNELNLTLQVDTPLASSLLLSRYDTGQPTVKPGERFTLRGTLLNVGSAPALDTILTFQPSVGSSTSGTTTTSTIFAPLGGSSLYVGNIPPDGGEISFEQEFIVNGTVESGIYNLPLTISYTRPDGSASDDQLTASVVVLVPPRLRFAEQFPISETARIGDTVSVSLAVVNLARRDVNLVSAQISGEGLDPLSTNEILLEPLRAGDETLLEGSLVAIQEGAGRIIIEVTYLDDFNQEAVLTQQYLVDVLPPLPPPATRENSIQTDTIPLVQVTPEPQGFTLPDDFFGRLLLGLLGLGN